MTDVASRNSKHLGVEHVEHVLGEELRDAAVPPGDVTDQLGGIVVPAQRERRQLQRSDPAVGRAGQLVDVVGVQVHAAEFVDQRRRFIGFETQGIRVDFEEFVLDAHAAGGQPGA